jgi:deoxyadenosine/deoxycytidine kinase
MGGPEGTLEAELEQLDNGLLGPSSLSPRFSRGGHGADTPATSSPLTLTSIPPNLSLSSSSSSSSAAFSSVSARNRDAPILLSLDGNIGAGKSTLLKALRIACPSLVCVKEPVDEWLEMKGADGRSILELFYADPKRWAYAFQHTTLLTRISNTREAVATAPPGSVVVSERSILTDRRVFATMLRDQGTLDPLEWDLYNRWYKKLAGETPVSAILYLSTCPDVCEERIARRNRPGEVIDKGYLRDLHDAHQSWLSTAGIPSLHVSFPDGEDPEEKLVPLIRTFIEEVRAGTAPSTPAPSE